MQIAVPMIMGLIMVLFGAELFTNAVEWIGRKLHLTQGAVGSVLAALGTALPETAVPVTAILLGGGSPQAEEVGIGGLLGAPFLLVTLGSLVVALAVQFTRKHSLKVLQVPRQGFERDMIHFLLAYTLTVVAGCVQIRLVHELVPLLLIALYINFVIQTLRDGGDSSQEHKLSNLYMQWKSTEPNGMVIIVQLTLALLLIVGGAQFLTIGVEQLATILAIPTFVLSALLIPVATELPETLNSVVWVRQNKDALALGNITGAMVFQSTLVPALGIWLTPWTFNGPALLTGSLTLAAAAMLFGLYRYHGALLPSTLFGASLFYWVLPIHTLAMRYGLSQVYWAGFTVFAMILTLVVRVGMRWRSL